MKQKFSIFKDSEKGQLIIQEHAELDKEIMSLLCEETYNISELGVAQSEGGESLMNRLRTNNMYPPGLYAERIAEKVIEVLGDPEYSAAELLFDDKEFFTMEAAEELEALDDNDDSVDVDVLLEDDIDEEIEDDYDDEKKIIKGLKSSIQVADDDGGDVDDV